MSPRALKPPDDLSRHVLVPFDGREAITVAVAARIAGFTPTHMRRLADAYNLGRPVGGGTWRISRVLLAAFLDGNAQALREYHTGLKAGPAIRLYFTRFGLTPPAGEQAA